MACGQIYFKEALAPDSNPPLSPLMAKYKTKNKQEKYSDERRNNLKVKIIDNVGTKENNWLFVSGQQPLDTAANQK